MPHLLLATDADDVVRDVAAALSVAGTTIDVVRNGKHVIPAVKARTPDLVILDLQIGNMGGMATCMALRLEASFGRVEDVDVLMLLDRRVDLFLAQRSDADGWLLKPLDALRLRRAATTIMDGGVWHEGTLEHPIESEAAQSAGGYEGETPRAPRGAPTDDLPAGEPADGAANPEGAGQVSTPAG